MNITATQAQTIVNALSSTASSINATTVQSALATVKGATFATLTQASKVKTAAAHKALNIYKVTIQNVTLCNSNSSLYSNAVNKQTEEAFTALPSNYEMINNSYSLVALKSNNAKHYLRAVINKCNGTAYYDADANTLLSKEQVATYLTPAASKTLLAPKTVNVVKHADIEHTVTPRVFALPNIYSLNVNKHVLLA